MSKRVMFGLVVVLVGLAMALIAFNVVTGSAESATNAVTNITALVAALVPLLAAVNGAAKEGVRSEVGVTRAPTPGRVASGLAADGPATVSRPLDFAAAEVAPFTVARSFEAGIYGGLFGGVVAGLLLAISYAVDVGPILVGTGLSTARLVAEIFVAGCLCGILIGAATQFGAHWLGHLGSTTGRLRSLRNEIVGGAVFGALAGLVAGVFIGLIFAPRPIPMIASGLLIAAAVIGAVAIPAGALLYDFRGNLRMLVRAFMLCAVLTALLLIPAAALLRALDAFDWFYSDSALLYAAAGAIIGGGLSAAVGAEIGGTLFLHRLWAARERTANRARQPAISH